MQAPALPLVGIIYPAGRNPREIVDHLEENWSPLAVQGRPYDFDFTAYYRQELGANLKRCWYVFSGLIEEYDLPGCKKETVRLEQQFLQSGNRCFNIDAGYITGAKLVLASHKNFSHRIALEENIYAEITLRYRQGTWYTHPWTYPDFKEPSRHSWLNEARGIWREKI